MATVRVARISLLTIVGAVGAAGFAMGAPLWASVAGSSVATALVFWMTRAKRAAQSQSVPAE